MRHATFGDRPTKLPANLHKPAYLDPLDTRSGAIWRDKFLAIVRAARSRSGLCQWSALIPTLRFWDAPRSQWIMPRGHRAFSSNLTALSAHMCACAHGPGRAEIACWLNTARTPSVRAVALCGTLKEHNVHSPEPTMGPPQLVNIKVVWRVASDRARSRARAHAVCPPCPLVMRSRERAEHCVRRARFPRTPAGRDSRALALLRAAGLRPRCWFFANREGKSRRATSSDFSRQLRPRAF